MGTDPASDAAYLCDRARQGAARVLEDLERSSRDLDQPWPRVASDVVQEGRGVVARTQAALRNVIDQLADCPTTPTEQTHR